MKVTPMMWTYPGSSSNGRIFYNLHRPHGALAGNLLLRSRPRVHAASRAIVGVIAFTVSQPSSWRRAHSRLLYQGVFGVAGRGHYVSPTFVTTYFSKLNRRFAPDRAAMTLRAVAICPFGIDAIPSNGAIGERRTSTR